MGGGSKEDVEGTSATPTEANLNDGGGDSDDRVCQRTTTRRHRPEVCGCNKTISVSFVKFNSSIASDAQNTL